MNTLTPPTTQSDYGLRPLVFDAATAHRDCHITYDDAGEVTCTHPELLSRLGAPLRIPTSRQYPLVRCTFDDLNKALSRLANSPALEGGGTLRQRYEAESARYEELAATAFAEGRWEPDYGSYVLDVARGDLYLVAPEEWHRLALVTSNAMLLTDPEGKLSWREVRQKLETAVVGFVGVSVGGNVLEGWLREARPRRTKIADPDWVETTNFNRGERMSLRHAGGRRAERFDPRNPYETNRVPKAEYIAYEEQLVDPYTRFDVYSEGITRSNLERFILGDGQNEPPIQILVEEMDNLELKVLVREVCRKHGVDVVMMSDFGHQVHLLWNHFHADPASPLSLSGNDEALLAALAGSKAGDRKKVFEFIDHLCGEDFAGDQFRAWIDGRGEQPTGSLPQSGATAMASGAIGGKEIALHVLGWHADRQRRVVYDLLRREARR